jgi:CRISPR-associated protein Cas8a1/Csx13
MAKKQIKPAVPDHLTMQLFAPGMSALHRAGLGGLACTLKAMERQYQEGRLTNSKLPAPFVDGAPPWDIDEQSITLRFGKPEKTAVYLQRLFEFAFAIRKDGLIELPGQHISECITPVLADLQLGLTLTILQFGRSRTLAKESSTVNYDPEGEGIPGITVEYRKCSGFKHQNGWRVFTGRNGTITPESVDIDGIISPGSVVRHAAFTTSTTAADPPERMLPLYFALVGCVALPVNRGVAVLLVPEVESLLDFIVDRPWMTPSTARQALVTNAADAALQSHVRMRVKKQICGTAISGCYAMTFTSTPWASQQKSRVATIQVPAGDDNLLNRFERALALLPPRIVTHMVKKTTGRGKNKIVMEHPESFRADSVIRPLIADNLALGRKWYASFTHLMIKNNPATKTPYRNQLFFERKGLYDMISDSTMWDQEGETLVVQAVHEAILHSLGRIRRETDGQNAKKLSQATKNRWERFREKLRLDLAGAKTEAQLRFALSDLFSRGGSNSVLRQSWEKVLPVIRSDWQLARDLGLLALVSYAGRCETDSDSEEKPDTNS